MMTQYGEHRVAAESLYDLASAVKAETGEELWAARCRSHSRDGRARMLLLHGNPSNLNDWRVLAPLLSAEHEIVAVDLPGFGKSEPVARRAGESRLDATARCIVALADTLGWHDPFFVVGHSHGGAVAQVVAARHPDRIAGVVLIATLGSPAHKAYRMLALPGVSRGLAIVAGLLRRRRCIPLFRALSPGIMRAIYPPSPLTRELIDGRLRDFVELPHILVSMADVACGSPSAQLLRDAEKIRAPVLFLHGADDALVPIAHAKTLFAAMKNAPGAASFETIQGAGHMLLATDALEVNRRITEWTRQLREGRSRGKV